MLYHHTLLEGPLEAPQEDVLQLTTRRVSRAVGRPALAPLDLPGAMDCCLPSCRAVLGPDGVVTETVTLDATFPLRCYKKAQAAAAPATDHPFELSLLVAELALSVPGASLEFDERSVDLRPFVATNTLQVSIRCGPPWKPDVDYSVDLDSDVALCVVERPPQEAPSLALVIILRGTVLENFARGGPRHAGQPRLPAVHRHARRGTVYVRRRWHRVPCCGPSRSWWAPGPAVAS